MTELWIIKRRSGQEEIRALLFKQKKRHAQQQIGVLDRFIQRDGELLLHPADAVEHDVSIGKKPVCPVFSTVSGMFSKPTAVQSLWEFSYALRMSSGR